MPVSGQHIFAPKCCFFRAMAGLLGAGMLLAPILACERKSEQPATAQAVAKVNGEAIAASVIQEKLQRFRREHGRLAFRSEHDLEKVRSRMLKEEIERKLVRQAARRLAIEVDDEAVDRALLRRRADYPGRAFEEYLVEARIPLSSLREDIRHRLLVQSLFRQEINPRVVVSPQEVAARYEEDPDRWALGEQVRARQIVTSTEEEANQLRRRLLRGESFEALARTHSLGPEGDRGGDLGWFTRGMMPPAIEDTCFKLSGNRFSEVVESQYGFHIFQVIDRRDGKPRPLSEVSSTIENELRLEKEYEAQRAYIDSLIEKARITVNESILAEVR